MHLCRWEINTGKTPPERQPEKQRLKLCGQGSCPTLATILCNPGLSHTAVHPDMGTTQLSDVPEDTHLQKAYTPGFWESLCWELSEGIHTGQGHQEVTRDLSPFCPG